ncbi:actin-like ATPase domain-containing protein [Martensiomyces pterosporus]|nr:actin-like ATPase domain-containing protein [Martensiomyces pterosporus]
MAVLAKEENFVVIELGGYVTKAVIDTTDVNKLPTVSIRTRAGIAKQAHDGDTTSAGELEDEKMDVDNSLDASKDPNEPSKSQPTTNSMDIDASSPTENETVADNADDQANEAATESDLKDDKSEAEVNYVFGEALESADADTIETTIDIIPDGYVKDWDALSALLRHILTKELGIRIIDNNSPILFSVPPLWPKTDLESLTQIAFEHLNAPSILITEQPLMAAFGNGAVTGVVIDIGNTSTTVSAIIDSCLQTSCIEQSPVAGATVTANLHALLQNSPEVKAQFDDGIVPKELAVALKESGLCRFQSILGDDDDSDKDDLEPTLFEFQGKKYTINEDILTAAPEILLSSTEAGSMPLATLIKHAILGCETDKRHLLWESIHVVGGSSQFKGLKDHLQRALESTVLPAGNIFANSQTREVRFASIPEYFVGWRNRDHWAAFLGASITAKIALGDSKHNINRTEYNESGPSIVHTKSF